MTRPPFDKKAAARLNRRARPELVEIQQPIPIPHDPEEVPGCHAMAMAAGLFLAILLVVVVGSQLAQKEERTLVIPSAPSTSSEADNSFAQMETTPKSVGGSKAEETEEEEETAPSYGNPLVIYVPRSKSYQSWMNVRFDPCNPDAQPVRWARDDEPFVRIHCMENVTPPVETGP